MTTFESKIKSIYFPQETIYNVLSDFNNLTFVKNRIPQDKIKDISFDTDSVSMTVEMMGNVKLRIINREPYKTIKITAEGTPSEAYMWIQLKEVDKNDTKIKITIKTKLNAMIKMMLKGKIDLFINGLADALVGIDYSKMEN